MKITVTIESDDLKEVAALTHAISNRIESKEERDQKKEPAKPIVEAPTEEFHSTPPLLTVDRPTAEDVTGDGRDGDVEIKEEPDPNKPWTKKYPNGCRVCGTKKKKPMGKGLCTTCYFSHRDMTDEQIEEAHLVYLNEHPESLEPQE